MNLIYDSQVEANYLWAIINRSEDFDPDIKSDFFEVALFRSIYERLYQLRLEGLNQWDFAILYPKFKRDEDRSWLASNDNELISKSLVPSYKEIIISKYKKILVERLMTETATESGEIDPYKFHKVLGQKLINTSKKVHAKDSKQVAKELFAHIEKAKEEGGLTGINCGFRAFNELFNGFQPGRLYVLAARPSMGKSALALNFVLNAAKSGSSVYVHCLEESLVSFSSRMLSNLSLVDNESIQRGRFSDSQWGPITEATGVLAKLKIHINDKANITAKQIIDEIEFTHNQEPVNFVVIDHIQDIARTEDSWHHDISNSCGLFKALAKDLNIPVLIISQLNRGVEQRQDKRPILSDLKESGDIEAKADVVFLMYRDEYYNPQTIDKGVVEIKVSKNRDGRIGMLRLGWEPNYMKFKELYM